MTITRFGSAALVFSLSTFTSFSTTDVRATEAGPQSRSSQSSTDLDSADIQRALDAVYPALVRIHVVSEDGGEGRMQKSRGSGSGTIISACNLESEAILGCDK